jgi:hypothetical protein
MTGSQKWIGKENSKFTAGRESSEETCGSLVREATELMNIFGAIVRKRE